MAGLRYLVGRAERCFLTTWILLTSPSVMVLDHWGGDWRIAGRAQRCYRPSIDTGDIVDVLGGSGPHFELDRIEVSTFDFYQV